MTGPEGLSGNPPQRPSPPAQAGGCLANFLGTVCGGIVGALGGIVLPERIPAWLVGPVCAVGSSMTAALLSAVIVRANAVEVASPSQTRLRTRIPFAVFMGGIAGIVSAVMIGLIDLLTGNLKRLGGVALGAVYGA